MPHPGAAGQGPDLVGLRPRWWRASSRYAAARAADDLLHPFARFKGDLTELARGAGVLTGSSAATRS